MEAMTVIPLVFFALIVILFIWAIIFMRVYRRDKKMLTEAFSEDKNALKQEMLYLEMAASYENKGDKDKALEYYFLYLRKKPDAKIYTKVGDYLSSINIEEAIQYWEKAATMGYKPAGDRLKEIGDKTEKKD